MERSKEVCTQFYDTLCPFPSITDCLEDAFVVTPSSPTDSRVRCRVETKYLGRGLFLVQYRLYRSYTEMSMTVTHKGQHVSGSPYFLGSMLHEDCACPLKTPKKWLTDFKCPKVEEQIAEDLAPFREEGVNVSGLYQRMEQAYPRNSLVHYSIVDGKVGASPELIFGTSGRGMCVSTWPQFFQRIL